ncbi:MAG TPA: YHS domain-containing (seleno)protein [Dongiaceae bacterium]|jgi:YHS domain-containing protein|nr:YHS domain-containing (seleno)protein [Dongiaceae bacterium]
MKKPIYLSMIMAIVFTALVAVGSASADGAKTFIWTNKQGVAINGYDPVAYFTDGKPAKGVPDYKTEWQGATWQFTSAAHRDLFAAAPEKYAPQYGGWCAFGVADGHAAETEPEKAWKIFNNKLYLNWDPDIAVKWQKDIPGYLQKSEANWQSVKAGILDGSGKIYRHDE